MEHYSFQVSMGKTIRVKRFLKGCNMEKEIRIRYNFLLYACKANSEAARLRKVTEQLNSDIRVLDETEEFCLKNQAPNRRGLQGLRL